MAIEKLPVNFKDDVIDTSFSDKRRYNLIANTDGTTSLEDVTTYTQIGSDFGAEQVNKTNATVNELIDKTSNINNTADAEKSVLYADTAGTAASAETSNYAETAGSAENSQRAERATLAEESNHANVANSAKNDFVLKNQEILTFSNNMCRIEDERITSDSLADVYFTSDSEGAAKEAVITVETYSGEVILTAIRTPQDVIRASIRIRVV